MKAVLKECNVLGTSNYKTKAKEGCPSQKRLSIDVYTGSEIVHISTDTVILSGMYDIEVEIVTYQGKLSYLKFISIV